MFLYRSPGESSSWGQRTYAVMVSGDENTIHLFYSIKFHWQMMRLKKTPIAIFTMALLIFETVSQNYGLEFKFVDLGNFKPADGPPMQKKAM